ncbi:MAG TPA: tetratricopeptide repeat protein, partial [Candidatus Dormibacteraeota bacterium]|nr:tetratricopeptide repeat protein [Candidatus Dormibacteraeota bacterium]
MLICPQCKTPNQDSAVNCSQCSTPVSIELDPGATLQTADPTAIRTGSDFGPRYRIESLIGQGGMGRVYKAYDRELDRTIAIKVVREGVMGETNALERFKQELVLASKISHKHILRIHDLGEVNGVKFITMAYVDGKDLHQVLKESPRLPLDRVLNYAAQLADALLAAHLEGVVHRDLKPQNVLVDKNDQLYVSDFGLAKSFAEGAAGMTQTGAFLGTPRYMSPEQAEGKATDGRSDLYAFGLILYEMAAGDIPFTGKSSLELMYQRISVAPKNPKLLNPEIPNWLAQIIMRCLEKDPEARYQNANEILEDLKTSGAGSSTSRTFSRTGSGASRSIQIAVPDFAGRRWPWIACGVLAILAIALAVPRVRQMVFGRNQRPPVPTSVSGIPPLSTGRFIAVLPLQILGNSSQLDYVAKGIQEAVSAKLFQLQDVRVTPVDAADQANQKQPLPKIARALGANLLVQGVLQGAGDKLRIVVNLENAATGQTLTSKEFDGVVADLFTIEDQIYRQLVAGLDVTPTNDELASAETRPTDNIAAYDLYLRGRNSLRGHDSKNIQSALDYFNQAAKADPSFALAYTGVADASLRMYKINKDPFWTQKALVAAQQAQQLNDKLPEVHAMLGSVYRTTGKYSESIAELKRALSLAPNSDEFYRRLGEVYLDSGNTSEALSSFQKAVTLNPYYWVNENALGEAYASAANYPKALQAFQQVSVLEPDIDAGFENVGNMYLQQGDYQKSIPYFQRALQIEPYFSTYSNLATSYFMLKQYPQAVSMFEKAVAMNPNDADVILNLADAYADLGQNDKARNTYLRTISTGFKELETNPQNADVMVDIALSYAKTGNATQALNFIRQARGIDKENVNYIYAEAEVDAMLGKTQAALSSLREALEKHYPAEYAAG